MAATAQSPNDPNVLWSQATLYRDDWGVPHIYADNVRAMAFAFGYAQAADHLETMLLAYRAANGRLSEVYGERYAAADEFAIMMGHGDLARRAYENADFTTRDLVEGFALGVNHWLVQHKSDAPPWAEGVQPSDILAFMHYYLMSQAPFDFDHRARRPKGTASGNAWAVAPSHSESGDAMLVINPHTAYDDLFQWYEAHLALGDFNVAGATLYGLPVILQGHNETLGWALTPNDADFADVYVESQPAFQRAPNSVNDIQHAAEAAFMLKTIAESKPFFVRTANGMQERRAPQQMSPHGPIVAQWAGRPVSYRIGGYGEFGALYQLMTMAAADSLASFQAALTLHQLPCFNVIYADAEGNIFHLYNAKVGRKRPLIEPAPNPLAGPVRSVWDGPLSSVDTAFQWGEIVPPAYLPFQSNPESGFLQACGSPPWRASGDVPDWNIDSWRWLARDADSYRAKRVRQLLSQGKRSFEDMQSMIFDPLAPFAVDVVPYLLSLAEGMPNLLDAGDPDLPAALDMLREWNHLADETSTAMTLFHAWWLTFKESCPVPVETDVDCYTVLSQPVPAIKEYALRALSEAVKRVRNQFQTINVPWGEANALWRGKSSVPVSGAATGEPILVAGQGPFRDGKWTVTYGYGFAMAVQFGNTPNAMSIVPFGTSDDPESPHFRDQMELFADRQMKRTYFAREAVERAATRAWGTYLVFRPSEGAARVQIRAQYPVEASVRSLEDSGTSIPPSYAEFSRFIEPEVRPPGVATEVIVEFSIPEALCARNNLQELGVYGYNSATGWAPLAEQRLDWDTRTFVGRITGGERFAVLGPARLRRAPVMLASTPAPVANRIAPSPIVPAPRDYTPINQRAAAAEREQAVEAGPGFSADLPDQAPAQLDTLSNGSEAITQTAPADTNATPPSPAEQPLPTQVAAAPETAPPQQAPPASQPAAKPEKKKGVQWSNAPLSELVDKRYKPRHTLFLVPQNALASPMIIGTDIELRPPVPGALFRLTTAQTVRAQVQVLDTPPAALPEGLAQFTYVFDIQYESLAVPGRTAVSLEVEPGVAKPGSIDKLQLYSYDVDNGWQPVAGQDVDPEGRSFSALDFAIRAYAVLGPVEYRTVPPRN